MRLLLALLLTVLPCAAQDSPLVKLSTLDARRGWEAVGRLDMGGRLFCTGALVDERLVLTAAHCLFDGSTGAEIPVGDIRFLAGLQNGRAQAERGARRVILHPEFQMADPDGLASVGRDLALIELDHPIRLPSVRPFATGDVVEPGTEVEVVSYAEGRLDAPSLQERCELLNAVPGVRVLSCDVDLGASGAPVFAVQDEELRIVSVVSSMANIEGRKVSLGIDLPAGLAVLERAAQGGTGGTRAGGAKVVRPGG